MFWKKNKPTENFINKNSTKQREFRFCIIYISRRFNHVLFVPQGKTDIGIHYEVDDIISDEWPCNFGKLQENIELTLDKYKSFTNYSKDRWPSYEASKAKSKQSFEVEYISIHLRTDLSKGYGEKEAERINVNAWPDKLQTTYCLTGTAHLIETKIAQIVCDIFEACEKIRS